MNFDYELRLLCGIIKLPYQALFDEKEDIWQKSAKIIKAVF